MTNTGMRAGMVPIGRRLRAYFAPVDRETGKATPFDPAKHGVFLLDAPPTPWIDLGWIENFARRSGTLVEPLRAGTRGAVSGQYRGELEALVEFDFREWGKVQMALSGGSEHMNVLAADPNADAQASGGSALPAVGVLPGSSAVELVVGAGAVGSFSKGDLVAVDVDYQQQSGYVGSAIAGGLREGSGERETRHRLCSSRDVQRRTRRGDDLYFALAGAASSSWSARSGCGSSAGGGFR